MGPFIFLYTILIALYVLTLHNQKRKSSRAIQAVFCAVVLIAIQGLRHNDIGIDSCNTYRPFFESVTSGLSNLFDFDDIYYGFELGFIVFTKFVKTMFDNTQFYIILCSIISIAPVAYLIYKYSKNIPLSFIIFSSFIVYHFGFSGIRQAMAVGVTCLAFECLMQKKAILFIIITLIASSIHSSAILFLISYPLYHHLCLSPAKLIIFGGIFVICLFIGDSIVIGLTELIFGGEKYLSKLMEDAVPSYNLMILLTAILLFTFTSNNDQILKFRSMLLMAVVFQSLGLISSSASRMAYYFIPYLSIALPMTTNSFRLRHLLEVGLIFLMVTFFFYLNGSGYLGVIPYKFFWVQ